MMFLRSFISDTRGYALLGIVLTIAVFSIFGLVFMGYTLNTAKQSNLIEDKIQATDLAEMGAEYYSYLISEIMKKELEEYLTDEESGSTVKEKLESIIRQVEINPSSYLYKKTMEHEDELFFEINGFDYDEVEQKITYEVVGKTEENEATIETTLELDFDRIQIDLADTDNWIDIIAPDAIFTDKCADKETNFINKKCKYESRTFGNGNKKSPTFNKSYFKVSGNLILPNLNNEDFNNSYIYVGGNLGAESNSQWANLNKAKNYNLYVAGDAWIGNTNNAKDANICVNRLRGYKGGDAKVYAIQNLSGYKGDNVTDDIKKFKENCWDPNGVGDSPSFNWNDPIIRKEYKYEN